MLKSNGFETSMWFLPQKHGGELYSEDLVEELYQGTLDSSIIGISVMDDFVHTAIQLTRRLRREGRIVIWGGANPTINPELGQRFADAVCIGDGEDALLELARRVDKGEDTGVISNIWFHDGQRPPLKPIEDISRLPRVDYGPDGHYIFDVEKNRFVSPATLEGYQTYLEPAPGTVPGNPQAFIYRIITTRGCPNSCTYCANSILKKIVSPRIRMKSYDQIVEELDWVRKNFPLVTHLAIADDSFLYRPDVREVAQAVKNAGLVFRCLIAPNHFNRDLMDHLMDCGLDVCQIGLQSRAPRVEDLYRRTYINKNIVQVLDYFRDHPRKIPIQVDIIVNNPWESTHDTVLTIKFLLRHLPSRAHLCILSLVFYHGTVLWKKALEENIIDDEFRYSTYAWRAQKSIRYTSILLSLFNKHWFPRKLIKVLATPPFLLVFDRPVWSNRIFPCLLYKTVSPFKLSQKRPGWPSLNPLKTKNQPAKRVSP